MPDITLSARSALSEQSLSIGGTTLSTADVEIVSIAVSESGGTRQPAEVGASPRLASRQNFADHLQRQHELALPGIGACTTSTTALTLLGLQACQWFMIRDETMSGASLFAELHASLSAHAWLSDQSDAWVCVDLHGERALAALELCCMLDLDAGLFAVGQVARTRMEHLSVILHRREQQAFRLLSARSSAADFWHMLATSLKNVA